MFQHGVIKQASRLFSGPDPQNALDWIDAMPPAATADVWADLRVVSAAFVDLQQARHRADYDLSARWSPLLAREWVARACGAFIVWQRVREAPLAGDYLLALLFPAKRT